MPPITKLKSELTLDSRKFNKGLGSARKKMKGFTNSLNSMKGGLIGVFGVAAVSAFVRNTLQSADAIGKFSDRIGISTTALQEWRFAFDKAGLSASETDKGLLNFVKNLGEARQGTGTLVTFLNKFDKSLLQVLQSENDNTRALEVLFKALGETENQADKVALANAALGRSGKQMVAAFKNGTASFDNWIKRGRELGVVIDDKLIRGAEELNDEISAVSEAISVKFKTAFLESTPVILQFTQALADALVQLNEFFNPSLEEQYKRLVAQGELALEVIKELEERPQHMFVRANLDEQFKKLNAINKELKELQAKMSQEVTIRLEKKSTALPDKPGRTDDSGIKTLLETIDLTDILDKKRASEFGKMFERASQQKALDKEVTSQLERQVRLLTIQASGNKELFALKEKQFELEDRLGRKLSENETLKLQAFITETEQLKKTIAENEKIRQRKALDKEVSSQLERQLQLLTIQASGHKELFALKEKQFQLEDRLGRKLSENETLKLQAFITETEGLRKIIAENEKTGQAIQQVWEAVGMRTEDALVNALTGAASAMEGFRDVAKAILADIMREIIRVQVTSRVFGKGGIVSSLVSAFTGGFDGGASALTGRTFANSPEFLGPGFAHGGSFTVPGSGGTDSSPVSFMATPGEQVDIRTPGQMKDDQGDNITIVQNIQTGVAQTVRAEMLALAPQFIEAARQSVFDANRRGGNFNRG